MAIKAVLTQISKGGEEKVFMVHTFNSKKHANDKTVIALTNLMEQLFKPDKEKLN